MSQSHHRTSGYLVPPYYCLHILITLPLQAHHCLFVSHGVTAYIAANSISEGRPPIHHQGRQMVASSSALALGRLTKMFGF